MGWFYGAIVSFYIRRKNKHSDVVFKQFLFLVFLLLTVVKNSKECMLVRLSQIYEYVVYFFDLVIDSFSNFLYQMCSLL